VLDLSGGMSSYYDDACVIAYTSIYPEVGDYDPHNEVHIVWRNPEN